MVTKGLHSGKIENIQRFREAVTSTNKSRRHLLNSKIPKDFGRGNIKNKYEDSRGSSLILWPRTSGDGVENVVHFSSAYHP